ncbi:MAG: hypothetical protein FJY95_17940 [Candidatus Handelsmanbacteria bacterium]|nr:hypothetical protein [Candidatus Handelsmanbacteria bacterium]
MSLIMMARLASPSMLWGLRSTAQRIVPRLPGLAGVLARPEGLDCPCRPRLSVPCLAWAGERCEVCDGEGWIEPMGEPAPD